MAPLEWKSDEGHGSTFWFTARLAKQPADEVAPTVSPVALHGLRLLIAERCPANRELLASLVQEWGCRWQEAETVTQAHAALAAGGMAPQLVLLDAALREQVAVPAGIPFVLLTPVNARPGSGAWPGPTVVKPIRQQELQRAMLQALDQVQRASAISLPSKPTASGRGYLLVAEDNATNQLVAKALLRRLGYHADIARNGREALQALCAMDYDAVLMDCQMPEMDGYQATAALRDPHSGVRNPRIPVIAMTAQAMIGDRERCLQAGMDDYLSKPISVAALGETLEKWIPCAITPGSRPPARDSAAASASVPTPE